jgi:hypothetical protein
MYTAQLLNIYDCISMYHVHRYPVYDPGTESRESLLFVHDVAEMLK